MISAQCVKQLGHSCDEEFKAQINKDLLLSNILNRALYNVQIQCFRKLVYEYCCINFCMSLKVWAVNWTNLWINPIWAISSKYNISCIHSR